MLNDKIDITGIDSKLTEDGNTSIAKRKILKNKKIAISVSINEDIEKLGFSEQHLNDISIELARYIIANSGIALYGGDLRVGGFSYLFSELSNQYKKTNDTTSRYINYFVFPNTKVLNKDVRIDFKSKQIGIVEVDPPNSIKIDENKDYYPNENLEDRYIYCECFRRMREQMAIDCDARILVGGKVCNYMGYLPGVIEEGLYTLLNNKPLYLVGGFGGATLKIIQLIEGENPNELSNDYQYTNDFLNRFKTFISNKYDYSDYEVLKNKIEEYSIERLSKENGLTIDENRKLFYSKNIHEITYLIMKGLRQALTD